MCLLICLFISLFCWHFFFCWTQLLETRHAESLNMAPSVNRSPRPQERKKNRENHPAKLSSRWLPVGIIWGPERFSPFLLPFLFPAWWAGWKAQPLHCCWHNHSGTAVTALLAWHLLLSRQREREGVLGRQKEREREKVRYKEGRKVWKRERNETRL